MAADHHLHDRRGVSCALITVSDTRTTADDRSGQLLRECLEGAGHVVMEAQILPDEASLVGTEIARLAANPSIQAVILTGGTGISPRDTTYEAVAGALEKRLDGFGELFRMLSYEEIGSAAMLSRAVGGTIGETVVFALPGSTAACRLGAEKLILPELGHLVALLSPTPTDSAGA
jgi:molybdenum cofactor biosynthesis protein B